MDCQEQLASWGGGRWLIIGLRPVRHRFPVVFVATGKAVIDLITARSFPG
jgi:hypothetical protein